MSIYNPYDYNFNRQNNYNYGVNNIPTYPSTMQNSLSQQNLMTNQNTIYFECRPVTSIEEAKAATVKWDGSPVVLIDRANKKHYEKRLNSDGTATFEVYDLVENQGQNPNIAVDRNEYIKQLEDKISILTSQNNQILEKLESYRDLFLQKEVMSYDADGKSNTDATNVEVKTKSNANASTNGRK